MCNAKIAHVLQLPSNFDTSPFYFIGSYVITTCASCAGVHPYKYPGMNFCVTDL